MSALFDPGREGFLTGEIDYDTAVIKISALRGYTFNAAHKYVSQISTAGGVVVATATLTGKTFANGVADANDVTFPSVPSGPAITSLMIYQSSAVIGGSDVAATAMRLIALIDSGTNLPITPNSGNIDLIFDNGSSRIFRI